MSDTSSRSPVGPRGDQQVPDQTERLARATLLLRQHTDAGWKAIEDTVLTRARQLFRPSAPVRAHHDLGDFFIAADVLVAELRQVIDAVPQAAALDITCSVGDDDVLESVTIQLVIAYGASLLETAGGVHGAALRRLRELLGALAPGAVDIHSHVHVGDVSDDPRIVS